MEAMETAMIISAITDAIFRIGAASEGMTEEEYKAKVEKIQVTADDLEKWLRGEE